MSVIVTLAELHLAYCDDLARRRQANAERHNRRGGNGGPTTGREALDISILGVRGECAAYLWLKPIKWHTYQETDISHLPDLDDFIDVKTVGRPGLRLIVQPTAPDEWAYLLVNGHAHPDYAIQGWLWGREAKLPEYSRDPVGGREAFFVPPSALRPPADLKAELARRLRLAHSKTR